MERASSRPLIRRARALRSLGLRGALGQARFWSRYGAARARDRAVEAVPAGAAAASIRLLESRYRPRDLNLYTSFPRVTEVLRATHELSPPVLLDVPPIPGLLERDTYWYSPVRVRDLANVQFDVDSGLAFTQGWVVNTTGTGHRWSMDSALITGAAFRVRARKGKPISGPVAWLANTRELYHFLMEALPTILRVLSVEPKTEFFGTEAPCQYAKETLAMLGIRYTILEPGEVLAAERFLFAEGYPRDRTHPADMELVRQALNPGAEREAGCERLYISRSGSTRSLRDESFLEERLESHGFRVVRLEELALPEQYRTVAGARIVVGSHGAGLTNVVFMEPGGHVVEIATGECWTNAYRRMAIARGHRYDLVSLPTVDDSYFGRADGREAWDRVRPLLEAAEDDSASSLPRDALG